MKSLKILLMLIPFISSLSYAQDITQIIVFKEKREMQLWQGDNLYKTYDIKLSVAYNNPTFKAKAKEREGDNRRIKI